MGKLADFLTGIQILEEIESPINGTIQVVKSLGYGTYLKVGGLTQSGGILESVWRKPLKKIQNSKFLPRRQAGKIQNCLVLGLGGGTVAKLVHKYWPDAKITGVDIDPLMVELGKKYLGLGDLEFKTVISDAYKFVSQRSKVKNYDLILIDLYHGDEFPEKFESEDFIRLTRSVLVKEGIAIFNRLYYGEKRPLAMKFLKKLEKNFRKVEVVYPEANIMFICS